MTKTILKQLFLLLLLSCGQHESGTSGDTVNEGNKWTTISTDTAKLSKLVDFKMFRPARVKFKYTFIDNSGHNERLSVPGPSDSYLQAVLYFDSSTFRQLNACYFSKVYESPNYGIQDFNFDWLDTGTKNELLMSDTSYHGHSDTFWNLGVKAKLWFLHDKVLLTK